MLFFDALCFQLFRFFFVAFAFCDKFFRKGCFCVFFALVKVVDAVLFADFLTFRDKFLFLHESKEAAKEQQHTRRHRSENNRISIDRQREHKRDGVNNERNRAACTAAKIDNRVCLRAQGFGRDVGHKRDCRASERCHRDKDKQQNHHINRKAGFTFRRFRNIFVNFVGNIVVHARRDVFVVMVVVFLYALIRFAVWRIPDKHDFAVFLFGFDFNAVVSIRRTAKP